MYFYGVGSDEWSDAEEVVERWTDVPPWITRLRNHTYLRVHLVRPTFVLLALMAVVASLLGESEMTSVELS